MSGVDRANGFALNVANFQTPRASIAYGRSISRGLGGGHFVIDTSRNGNGPPSGSGVDRWCKSPGRALGEPPTTSTADRLVDALLWVKYPGESDGSCYRGHPPAGAWWPAYALALARAGG
jgi:endoglucanase